MHHCLFCHVVANDCMRVTVLFMGSDLGGIFHCCSTLAELLAIAVPRPLKQPETSGDESEYLGMQNVYL